MEKEMNLIEAYFRCDKKQKRAIDKAYKNWAAQQGCIVTDATPVVLHHLRDVRLSYIDGYVVGAGIRPPDIFMLPLIPQYHSYDGFKDSIHRIGNEKFEKTHNLNLFSKLQGLHEIFMAVTALKGAFE